MEVLLSTPPTGSTSRDGGRQLDAQVLFTAAWGRKQADVNEGWRFHEAQLVDGRFNVTGLNWAMIRTVCKIPFLAGLCPPAPSSKRSSPSPSSYAFECNKGWTKLCCPRFHLTTITFWIEQKKTLFLVTSLIFFPVLILQQSKHLCLLQAEGAMLKVACTNAFTAPTMGTPALIYRRFPGVCHVCSVFPTLSQCVGAMVRIFCQSVYPPAVVLNSHMSENPICFLSLSDAFSFLFPLLDWIVVYRFRNATSARSIRLWHIKQQSLYYKEHAVIVSGVLGARWEPGFFSLSSLDREAHMGLCGLNF